MACFEPSGNGLTIPTTQPPPPTLRVMAARGRMRGEGRGEGGGGRGGEEDPAPKSSCQSSRPRLGGVPYHVVSYMILSSPSPIGGGGGRGGQREWLLLLASTTRLDCRLDPLIAVPHGTERRVVGNKINRHRETMFGGGGKHDGWGGE